MQACSLPKTKLLTKPWQYRDVYRRGRRLYGQDFGLVYVLGAEEESRVGISIHGVKKATRRNRIKRIVREWFRLHGHDLKPAVDVVFTIRSGFALDSPDQFMQTLKKLINNARLIRPRENMAEQAVWPILTLTGNSNTAVRAGEPSSSTMINPA